MSVKKKAKSIAKKPLSKGKSLEKDTIAAIAGAGLVAITLLIILILTGFATGGEARKLLIDTLPTTRFLASGVIGASATILALMLTLLGLTGKSSEDFSDSFYARIQQVSKLCAITFTLGVAFLVLHSVPIQQAGNPSSTIFTVLYYVAVGFASLLGAMLVAIMLQLYFTVRDMISVFSH